MERARWVIVTFCAAALVCLPAPVRAEAKPPAVEPIDFAYSAADKCPTEEQFIATVRRYTARWKVANEGAARRFQIRLASRGERVDGSLLVTAADGKTTERTIPGDECETVARALAVVVALAIDPRARLGGAGPEPELEPEPEPEAAPPPTPVVPDVAPRRPPRAPALSARPRPSRWTFAVEARAELTSAVVSEALPVVGAAFEARVRLTDHAWLWPSLALGVRQSILKDIEAPIGSSEFLWTAATIRLCPVRLMVGRFDLAPCAEANIGVLQAAARGVAEARTTSTPWFDRGGSLRAAYHLGRWGVGLGLLVTAPTSRKRFTFETGELVSQAPPVGLTAGLLVEFRL